MLSDVQIMEFIKIYKKSFGVELDKKEVYEKGIKLLRIIELVYKPITQKEYEMLLERREQTK